MCLLLIFGRLGVITGTNLVGYLMEFCCPANFIGFGVLLGGTNTFTNVLRLSASFRNLPLSSLFETKKLLSYNINRVSITCTYTN